MSATGKEFWWTKNGDDLPHALTEVIRSIDMNQEYRRQSNLRNLRLYGNTKTMGLGGAEYAQSNDSGTRLTLNVVRAVIDTAAASIGTNRPRARFLTKAGDWEQQRRAQNLTKFTDGQFSFQKVYRKSRAVFKDAAIFGTGFLKVFTDHDKIQCERVFPDEIFVDDQDGRYGDPMCVYQHKEVERAILRSYYKTKRTLSVKLDTAEKIRDSNPFGTDLADAVSVIEAWKRPSYEGAKDGRHIICTSNSLIIDEPWDSPAPIAVFRYNEATLGYYGQGIADELKGIQLEINYLLRKIQRHLNMSTVKIALQKGSKINKADLNNTEFGTIEYTGKQPMFHVIQALSPEFYQQVDALYQRAFEVAGVSQLSATSRKPSGLDSGQAIRDYNDIQSQRFQTVGQSWEDYHLDIADQMISRARELDESGVKVFSLAKRGNELEEIAWSDVSMERDKYVMQCFPTSYLPRTPSARLQAVQELIQVFPQMQQQAMGLLDYPDVDATTQNLTAPQRIMDKIVYMALEKGEFVGPEPYMDLEYGMSFIQNSYLRAMIDGAPEDRLDLLRKWIRIAEGILKSAQPAMMPPEGQPGMPAQMPPEQGAPPMM